MTRTPRRIGVDKHRRISTTLSKQPRWVPAAIIRNSSLRGAGERKGQAVEFHEVEPATATEEAPVWTIVEQGEGTIIAELPGRS